MFTYYLDLARRSLGRNVALTALMIVAIAFGVGASMTTLTVLHVLSVDPIPAKSHDLYYVQLDPRKKAARRGRPAMPRGSTPRRWSAHKADRQAMMTGAGAIEASARAPPFYPRAVEHGRVLAMFGVSSRAAVARDRRRTQRSGRGDRARSPTSCSGRSTWSAGAPRRWQPPDRRRPNSVSTRTSRPQPARTEGEPMFAPLDPRASSLAAATDYLGQHQDVDRRRRLRLQFCQLDSPPRPRRTASPGAYSVTAEGGAGGGRPRRQNVMEWLRPRGGAPDARLQT
jgi:hypothetical protein